MANTSFLEKISWGEKERSNFKLRLFGIKKDNFHLVSFI